MKTNVAETSRDCYYDAQEDFEAIKVKILDRLEHGKTYTRREISEMVNIEYTCACGRVWDLVNKDKAMVDLPKEPRGKKNRMVKVVALVTA